VNPILLKTTLLINLMRQQLHITAGAFNSSSSLQQLVNNLVISSLPAARNHNTNIVNEVTEGIALGGSMHEVVIVMKDILTTVVANSRNGNIHITAARYKDVVIVEIQERNNYNGYALSFSLGSIEPEAALIGGHLSIRGQQQKVTTISFSFPDNLLAA